MVLQHGPSKHLSVLLTPMKEVTDCFKACWAYVAWDRTSILFQRHQASGRAGLIQVIKQVRDHLAVISREQTPVNQ